VADYLADGATEEKTATVTSVQQQTSGWILDGGKRGGGH
jgi:hypothetical protein